MNEEACKYELMECPFCGGKARRHEVGQDDDLNAGGNYIACDDCLACTELVFPCGEDPEPKLRELWNKRA